MLFCHIWAASLLFIFIYLITDYPVLLGRKHIFGDGWGCKWNWTGINRVEMKVAVVGGHGWNLFPCRSCSFEDLGEGNNDVMLVYYWPHLFTFSLLAGSCRRPVLKLLMGPFVMPNFGFLWQYLPIPWPETSKFPILANIPPSIRKHLARLYNICTLQVYIIKIWCESVFK